MDIAGIIKKVRFFLADKKAIIWSDDELEDMIYQALEQYSFDSGLFTGTFNLVPDADGKYSFPDDFLGFLIAWNENGQEIKMTTSKELFEKQGLPGDKKGSILYIYKDSSTLNGFEVYPQADLNVKVNALLDERDKPWGEIIAGSAGVVDNGQWGLSLTLKEYIFGGDCVYTRVASLQEVKDYMALVYYTLYMAYSSDSEFANINLASSYLQQYKGRVNATGNINFSNVGKKVNSVYY